MVSRKQKKKQPQDKFVVVPLKKELRQQVHKALQAFQYGKTQRKSDAGFEKLKKLAKCLKRRDNMPKLSLNGILLNAIRKHGSPIVGEYLELKSKLEEGQYLMAQYWKEHHLCAVPIDNKEQYESAINGADTDVEFFALDEKFLPTYNI